MAYARGKYAKAISDRSGLEFPYNEMVKEWNGSFVHKSEFEAKHPQIRIKHIKADAIALSNARPQHTSPTIVDLDANAFFSPDPDSLLPPRTPDEENRKRNLSVSIGSVVVIGDAVGVTVFAVTVVSTDSGNKYVIDGVQQATLNFTRGSTYRFSQSDSTNGGHPLRLSTTSNGTHAGGSAYTDGVTTSGVPGTDGYTQITVASDAPDTLYYYCSVHSAMGGQINITG